MPTSQEIIAALIGSWKIARRDPTALHSFDLSADAFWRSFSAFFVALPFYLVFITTGWRINSEAAIDIAASQFGYSLSELLAYAVLWVLYPVVVAGLCQAAKITQYFAAYVIVYNWSSILVAAFMVPPYILFSLGLLSLETLTVTVFFVFISVLLYRWLVALTVLRCSPFMAIGMVATDLGLSVVVAQTAQAIGELGAA